MERLECWGREIRQDAGIEHGVVEMDDMQVWERLECGALGQVEGACQVILCLCRDLQALEEGECAGEAEDRWQTKVASRRMAEREG
jgi:hypothetical protein